MFFFRKIWRALYSCNTRFKISSFALLPTKSSFQRLVVAFIIIIIIIIIIINLF